MPTKKSIKEIKEDFKKAVEASRLPTISLSEQDTKSELGWKSLILHANRTIIGPYRSLKLAPNKINSEGVEVRNKEARKMAEAFIKFDVDNTELLFDEIEQRNDSLQLINQKIIDQTSQMEDSFNIMQFQFTTEDERLTPNGTWIQEIVELMNKNNANVLFFIPPTHIDSVLKVLEYQISAFQANSKLTNPMYIAGYIPPLSPEQSVQLEDIYVESGINTVFYDLKNRSPHDRGLSHLVALSLKSKGTYLYTHGLNASPGKKAMPFPSIYDLWLPSFGLQSISNLRRLGGGPTNKKKEKIDSRLTLPFRCVHGYYYPKYGAVHSKEFQCPKCNIQPIEDAFDDKKIRVHQECTRFNAEESSKELKKIGIKIKEMTLRKYLYMKEGLKPIEYKNQLEWFEHEVKREKQKLNVVSLEEFY